MNNSPAPFIYPIPKRQILDSSNLKEFADDNLNLMKMAESFPKGLKTLWEKEKLLLIGNFSFSHRVFKRLLSRRHVKTRAYVFGKGSKTLGKEEIACHKQFLLFPQSLLPI